MYKDLEPRSPGKSPLMMKETDPETIDLQIAAGLEAASGRFFGFTNNFEAKLPGGHMREMIVNHSWDKAKLYTPEKTSAEVAELYSEKAAQTTFSEFFQDIDSAIEATGLDPELLSQIRRDRETATGLDVSAAQEAYCEAILPVYRELRIMGYSHYDLWV